MASARPSPTPEGPRGFFLVLEGLDGSGKDSLLARLLPRFWSDDPKEVLSLGKGTRAARLREPSAHSAWGRRLMTALSDGTLGKWTPEQVARAYVGDRIRQAAEIRRLVRNGFAVLSSRSDLSTYAYQGSQGVPLEDLYRAHRYGPRGAAVPDLTILVEVDADTCLERMALRGGRPEYFEKKDSLERIAKAYAKACAWLRKKDGRTLVRIDGKGSPSEVEARAAEAISRWLRRNRR